MDNALQGVPLGLSIKKRIQPRHSAAYPRGLGLSLCEKCWKQAPFSCATSGPWPPLPPTPTRWWLCSPGLKLLIALHSGVLGGPGGPRGGRGHVTLCPKSTVSLTSSEEELDKWPLCLLALK